MTAVYERIADGEFDYLLEAEYNFLAGGVTTGNTIEVVQLLTIEGTRSLGVGDELGSLAVGKWADVVLLEVESMREELPV